jgi:hypothetical protein
MTNRRAVIRLGSAAFTAILAGCVGGGGGDAGEEGENGEATATPTETPAGTQLTDLVEITGHEWRGRSILSATVRNISDSTIGTLQIDVNVYDGDTRISDGYGTITDLPSGIEDTVRVRMGDFSAVPCEAATTYDLVPNFYFNNEQYEERFEYEYDPDFCE